MKTAIDYDLQPGTRGLKWYRFWTPGLAIYKSKAKIVEALNLGLTVYCEDKIMGDISRWNGEKWEIETVFVRCEPKEATHLARELDRARPHHHEEWLKAITFKELTKH